MIYKEERRDLFEVPDDYILVHCISSDFALGAGIAKKFAQMGVKEKLVKNYPKNWEGHGYMIPVGLNDKMVANLITKEKYWMKPTYDTLRESLENLKNWVIAENYLPWGDIRPIGIQWKLAMPLIGCGLDKLKWDNVRQIIKEVFENTDIEILVCLYK